MTKQPFRGMTIRLPEPLARKLELAAKAQGIALIEAIRIAITNYVDDPNLRDKIREGLLRRTEEAERLLKAFDDAGDQK